MTEMGSIQPLERIRLTDLRVGDTSPLPYDTTDEPDFDLVPHILALGEDKVKPFPYDDQVSNLLATASGWAYSDATSLSSILDRRGLPRNRVRYVSVQNDACLIFSKGYLIQSEDGRVLILNFRGTEPLSVINWMVDLSFKMERFYSLGHIHGGFNKNVGAIWPYIMLPMKDALNGKPIAGTKDTFTKPDGSQGKIVAPEVIYITGHSLGAAMAAVAGAIIFTDPKYIALRKLVKGVYTYGQPMIGDPELSNRCEQAFGQMTYRHVFGVDFVPRMPTVTTGNFKHFGREYISTETGWVQRSVSAQQAVSTVISAAVAGAAFVMNQIPVFANVKMPFSADDHSPNHYMRCSGLPRPGSEFE